MNISARVRNRLNDHQATVTTNDSTQPIMIPPRTSGFGSSTNGGELLFLALATCYCNDIYREAAHRGISVHEVEVEVDGTFGGPGDPATGVTYRARVMADATDDDIADLMRHTDRVAEIQNTLRAGVAVQLGDITPVSRPADPVDLA
ncbi:MAG TPA: OsmC family protein [Thermomicrobiales bacterium]|jgi:organic hydroperoxide reductase OsmC/OhrA|nr:OsmC family protein [Thermomicrobiales bacterium]